MTTTIPPVLLGDRMRVALSKTDLGAGEMAEYLGVSRNSVSTWLSNRAVPRTSALRLWALRCEVPYEWLLLDPGVAQAADLAELHAQGVYVDMDVDHDIDADASAGVVRPKGLEPLTS